MKKFLFVMWFVVLFMVGCYEPGKETVTGVITVTSESAVTVRYEAIEGDDVIIESVGGECKYYFAFEAEEEGGLDPYWLNVNVESQSGAQDIHITLTIDGEVGTFYNDGTDVLSLALRAFYCPPWTTQCAKVTIGW